MNSSLSTHALAHRTSTQSLPPATSIPSAATSSGTARSNIGETAAGNLRADTARAIDAPKQTAAAPRIRDQETADRSNRRPGAREAPAGPPPAFKESPLERQARVALDPPEIVAETQQATLEPWPGTDPETSLAIAEDPEAHGQIDPPLTPRLRAEASFAEAQSIAEQRNDTSLDLSA